MGKDGDPGVDRPVGAATSPPATTHQHQPRTTSPTARDPRLQSARVRLPDGTHRDFELPRGSEGEVLFRQVTADLSIEEKEYFSLCFYDKTAARHWLYNDKKILKQLKGLPWTFSYEVKFYPTEPSKLVDDCARFNLYLQLRRDVYTGRLPVTLQTNAILGSYAAQAEFGDAVDSPEYSNYLVHAKIAPNINEQLAQAISDLHKQHKGQTPAEAENHYLEACRELAMYGIFLFPAKDAKSDNVMIGVGAYGINVYKDAVRMHKFNWQNIIKISYRKNSFSIKLKPGELGQKEATVTYKLEDYLHAKRVWKCAVEHHTFFRLIQPEDKPHGHFFGLGSTRFRYHGRTQFQTKMASQMFDRPASATIDRSHRLSQSLNDMASETVRPLHYTDTEIEREKLSPAMSYTLKEHGVLVPEKRKKHQKTVITTTTATKTSELTPEQVVDGQEGPDDDRLIYTPSTTIESPTGGSYYLSDDGLRSATRSPYSPSGYAEYDPSSPYSDQYSHPAIQSYSHGTAIAVIEGRPSDERRTQTMPGGVQMRHQSTAVRRNLFGRPTSSGRSSRSSAKLVSYHQAYDPLEPLSTLEYSDLPSTPLAQSVTVYHQGYYNRLELPDARERARDAPRPYVATTNGVHRMEELDRGDDMAERPIRHFVDIRHSGASKPARIKRIVHEGKEEYGKAIDPKDYAFTQARWEEHPMHQTQLAQEIRPSNIRQHSNVYYQHSDEAGPSGMMQEEELPRYRLITRQLPPAPSPSAETKREKEKKRRSGEHESRAERGHISDSHVRAQIYQKEHTASTSIRRESPDSITRSRVSADISSREGSRVAEHRTPAPADLPTPVKGKKEKRKRKHPKEPATPPEEPRKVRLIAKIPPTQQSPQDETTPEGRTPSSSSLRFSLWKAARRSRQAAGTTPEPTARYTGDLDEISRQRELEKMDLENRPPAESLSPRSVSRTKTTSPVGRPGKRDRFLKRKHDHQATASPEVSRYGFSTEPFTGHVSAFDRNADLEPVPLDVEERTFEQMSAPKEKPKKRAILHLRRTKSPTAAAEQMPEEGREVRLIARVLPQQPQVEEREVSSETTKTRIGFLKKQPKKSGKAVISTREIGEHYEGPLESTRYNEDLGLLPLENRPTQVSYSPSTLTKRTVIGHHVSEEKHRAESPEKIVHVKTKPGYDFDNTPYSGYLEKISYEEPLHKQHLPEFVDVYNVRAYEPARIIEEKQQKSKELSPEEEHRRLLKVKTRPDDEEEPREEHDEHHKHSIGFGAFWKKGRRPSHEVAAEWPSSEPFTGAYESVSRTHDLELSDLEARPTQYSMSPKLVKKHAPSPKASPRPTIGYDISTEPYLHEVETVHRSADLEPEPLEQHVAVQMHEERRIEESKPKRKAILHVGKSKAAAEPVADEPREVRLVARVIPQQKEQAEGGETIHEEPRERTGGFFRRTRKSKEPEPATAIVERYTGPLDDVYRDNELAELPLPAHPSSSQIPEATLRKEKVTPSPVGTTERRYKLWMRSRHAGDEEIVPKDKIKREAYVFDPARYEGEMFETTKSSDLPSSSIHEHVSTLPSSTIYKQQKAILHLKQPRSTSPRSATPAEEESREVRLLARIAPPTEEVVVEESKVGKIKKEKSPGRFTFAKGARRGQPEPSMQISEKYEGPLDETYYRELSGQTIDFQLPSVSYDMKESPKREREPKSPAATAESRRVRLLARLRHEGEEDVVPKEKIKAAHYDFSSEPYTGEMYEFTRFNDLPAMSIKDYVSTLPAEDIYKVHKVEKEPKKRAILHLKRSKTESPRTVDEEQPQEVRLLARVAPPTEVSEEPKVGGRIKKEKTPSRFAFVKGSRQAEPTVSTLGPEYTGPLDETKYHELSGQPIDFQLPSVSYDIKESPKRVREQKSPVITEERRFRLLTRLRHEGEEDVVPKEKVTSTHYVFDPSRYEGELNEIGRSNELPSSSIQEHVSSLPSSTIYHIKKQKAESPRSPHPAVEEEQREVRLLAKIRPPPEIVDEQKTGKIEKEKSPGRFAFISRRSTETKTPEFGERYEGPVSEEQRMSELPEVALESRPTVSYDVRTSPKREQKPSSPRSAETEERKLRLLTKFKHEEHEEAVPKEKISKTAYDFSIEPFTGELSQLPRSEDLLGEPILSHVEALPKEQHYAISVKPKKIRKEDIVHVTHEEAGPHDLKLKVLVRPEDEQVEERKGTLSPGRIAFWKRSKPSEQHEYYPSTTAVDPSQVTEIQRTDDMEKSPFDIPILAEKQSTELERSASQTSEKRYRLIARRKTPEEKEKVSTTPLKSSYYEQLDRTPYTGDIGEIGPQSDISGLQLREYVHLQDIPSSAAVEKVEKKPKKKAVLYFKSSEQPSTSEEQTPVRLVAKILPSEEEAVQVEPTGKKTIGFGKLMKKTRRSIERPITVEPYSGPVESISRNDDLEKIELAARPQVSPKAEVKTTPTQSLRYRLITRLRHEGEESTVAPDLSTYAYSREPYEGELDTVNRLADIDSTPLDQHVAIQKIEHKLPKTPVSPPRIEEEPHQIRAKILVQPSTDEEMHRETTPTGFGFWSKRKEHKKEPKQQYSPILSAATTDIEETQKSSDLEKMPLGITVPSSPAKVKQESEQLSPETERRLRLIVRKRKEESPEDRRVEQERHLGAAAAYAFDQAPYEGPLEQISRMPDIDGVQLRDYVEVKDIPQMPAESPKKLRLHLRSPRSPTKTPTPSPEITPEEEQRQQVLKVRVAPSEEQPEAERGMEAGRVGFFKKSKRIQEASVPSLGEKYEGPLVSTQYHEFSGEPLAVKPSVSSYEPKVEAITKKIRGVKKPEVPSPQLEERYTGPVSSTDYSEFSGQPIDFQLPSVSYDKEAERVEKPKKAVLHLRSSATETVSVPEVPEEPRQQVLKVRVMPPKSTEIESEAAASAKSPKRMAHVTTRELEEKYTGPLASTEYHELSSEPLTVRPSVSSYEPRVEKIERKIPRSKKPKTTSPEFGERYTGPLDSTTYHELSGEPLGFQPASVSYIKEAEKIEKPKKAILHLRSSAADDENIPEEPRQQVLKVKVMPSQPVDVQNEVAVVKSPKHRAQVPTRDLEEKYTGPLASTEYHELIGEPLAVRPSVSSYEPKVETIERASRRGKKEMASTSSPTLGERYTGDLESTDYSEFSGQPIDFQLPSVKEAEKIEKPKKAILHLRSSAADDENAPEEPRQQVLKVRVMPPKSTEIESEVAASAKSPKRRVQVPTHELEEKYTGPLASTEYHELAGEPLAVRPSVSSYEPIAETIVKKTRRIKKHEISSPLGERYTGDLESTQYNEFTGQPIDFQLPSVSYIKEAEKIEKPKKAILHLRSSAADDENVPEEAHQQVLKVRVVPSEPAEASRDIGEGQKVLSWRRGKKPTKETYPTAFASERYDGPLDETLRSRDLEKLPIENLPSVAYSPKQIAEEHHKEISDETTTSQKRYKLIARLRHPSTDEDKIKAERPASPYALSSEPWKGDVDTTNRATELDSSRLDEFVTIQRPVAEVKERKIRSPKKEKIAHVGRDEELPEEEKPIRLKVLVHPPEGPAYEDEAASGLVSPTRPSPGKTGKLVLWKKTKERRTYDPVLSTTTGMITETQRTSDMSNIPLDSSIDTRPVIPQPQKIVKKKEKIEKVKPAKLLAYDFDTTPYTAEVDQINPTPDISGSNLREYVNIQDIPTPTEQKARRAILHLKKPSSPTVSEEERQQVLKVKIRPQEPVGEEQPSPRGSLGFGKLLKRGSRRSTDVESPVMPSQPYTGPLETTIRTEELGMSQLEARPSTFTYSPTAEQKKFRVIGFHTETRSLEPTPEPEKHHRSGYDFTTDAYEGPLDTTGRMAELDSAPLREHADVYHPGHYKSLRAVSPTKGAKEPAEWETFEEPRETRFIARIKPEDEPPIEEEHRAGSAAGGRFGFFKKREHEAPSPVLGEKYEGPLSTTDYNELTGEPLTVSPIVSYSPKASPLPSPQQAVSPSESEKRRFRLFGHHRHEKGYPISTEAYLGDLSTVHYSGDIDSHPLNKYVEKREYVYDRPAEKPAEKPKKKAILHLREAAESPTAPSIEEEKHDVRLVARIMPEQREEDENEKPPSASPLAFFKRTKKPSPLVELGEKYSGPLESTSYNELSGLPLDQHPAIVNYPDPSSVKEKRSKSKIPVSSERKQVRLLARLRHEGEEDVVPKEKIRAAHYDFSSEPYTGEMYEFARFNDLPAMSIKDYVSTLPAEDIYKVHKVEKEPKKRAILHLKRPKSETPKEIIEEPREVRILARIAPPAEVDETQPSTSAAVREKSPRQFKLLKTRKSKETGVPMPISERYEGPVSDVSYNEMSGMPLDKSMVPAFVSYDVRKERVPPHPVAAEPRRMRLLTRIRHEGEEDVVPKEQVKTAAYDFPTTAYEGELDRIARSDEMPTSSLQEHVTLQKTAPIPSADTKKRAILHLKREPKPSAEIVEEPPREVRLLARISPPAEQIEEAKPSKFSFIKKQQPTEQAPLEERYTGPLESTSYGEFQGIPLEARPPIIGYDVKPPIVKKEHIKSSVYDFSQEPFTGELSEISRSGELPPESIQSHVTVLPTKDIYVTSPKPKKIQKEDIIHVTHEEPEQREVRVKVLVKPDEEVEKKAELESSPSKSRGFWKRSEKQPKFEMVYHTTERYEGDLTDVSPTRELESLKLDVSAPIISSEPSKVHREEEMSPQTRYRLLAKIRAPAHDEDIVEKQHLKKADYGFDPQSYEATDTTQLQKELDPANLSEQVALYHSGEYVSKSVSPTKKERRAILHLKKSPEKSAEVIEEEVPPTRLKVLIRPSEEESREEPVVQTTPLSSRVRSVLKRPAREAKPAIAFDVSKYEGPLDTTEMQRDLDALPLEARPQITAPIAPPRKLKVREGKSRYDFDTSQYQGSLHETGRTSDIDSIQLRDQVPVVYGGEYPQEDTRKRKAVLHLKKSEVSEEEPTQIRVKTIIRPQEEQLVETSLEPSTAKTRGFWKKSSPKPSPQIETVYHTTERYEGDLSAVSPTHELEPLKLDVAAPVIRTESPRVQEQQLKKTYYDFDPQSYEASDTTYRQKDLESAPLSARPQVQSVPISPPKIRIETTPSPTEERRLRLLATVKTPEPEEQIAVKLPTAKYQFDTTPYEGEYGTIERRLDLEGIPIGEHVEIREIPPPPPTRERKAILHLKRSPVSQETTIETVQEEPKETRLKVLVRPDETEEEYTPRPSSSRGTSPFQFGFLKSRTKEAYSPVSSVEAYTGPVGEVKRQPEVDALPLSAIPSTTVYRTPSAAEEKDKSRYRLLLKSRSAEAKSKTPDRAYAFDMQPWTGELEQINRQNELDPSDLRQAVTVYHKGESVEDVKPKKKAVLHLKKPEQPTTREDQPRSVKLIALIKPSEEELPRATRPPPSSKPSSSARTETRQLPAVTERYEGPVSETVRSEELEPRPLEALPNLPSVEHPRSPKLKKEKKVKAAKDKPAVETTEEEPRQQRIVAIVKPEEPKLEKEEKAGRAFGLFKTRSHPSHEVEVSHAYEKYEGALESVAPAQEIESTPLPAAPAVYSYSPKAVHQEKPKSPVLDEERRLKLMAKIRRGTDERQEEQTSPRVGYGYDFSTESFEPFDTTHRQLELDSQPLQEHSAVYYHGPYHIVRTPAKSEEEGKLFGLFGHRKSRTPQEEGEAVSEPRETRLIALVRPEPIQQQEEQTPTTQVGSRKLFWKGRRSPHDISAYAVPEMTGQLDEINKDSDLEKLPLEHSPASIEYSPKYERAATHRAKAEKIEESPQAERKFKLIALVRKEKDEPEAKRTKPAQPPPAYGFATTSADYPVQSIAPQDELQTTPMDTLERREAVSSPESTRKKKRFLYGFRSAKSTGQEKPTTSEVRLVARVLPEARESADDHLARRSELEGRELNISRLEIPPPRVRTPETARVQLRESVVNYLPSSTELHTYRPARVEGRTVDGEDYVELRVDRRVEVQLEPVYVLQSEGLGVLSEDEGGIIYTSTATAMSPQSQRRSFFSRFGFTSSKGTKRKKARKGAKEADSSESSDSDDEKRQLDLVVSQESGQPHTTISSWQESTNLPDEVIVEYDEYGNKITRTVKTSQVKHTVQKQTFQNYVVDDQPGAVRVERSREQFTPVGTRPSGTSPIVETHSRTVTYENPQASSHTGDAGDTELQVLGEFVSSKTVTQGNRTIETVTYKTEKDGIVETHVEHRVTIHSEDPIDHDAELSQAILEATQLNPDMTVEKIEVRQESTSGNQ